MDPDHRLSHLSLRRYNLRYTKSTKSTRPTRVRLYNRQVIDQLLLAILVHNHFSPEYN